jgi:hypothetical protein
MNMQPFGWLMQREHFGECEHFGRNQHGLTDNRLLSMNSEHDTTTQLNEEAVQTVPIIVAASTVAAAASIKMLQLGTSYIHALNVAGECICISQELRERLRGWIYLLLDYFNCFSQD